MADSEPREIDWQTAEVQDGELTVALSGRVSKDWSSHFEGLVRLLEPRTAEWGQVGLQKHKLRVADVRPGAEEELRHFLESLVLQVNSHLAKDPQLDAGDPAHERDPAKVAAAEMTATFRSFADVDH